MTYFVHFDVNYKLLEFPVFTEDPRYGLTATCKRVFENTYHFGCKQIYNDDDDLKEYILSELANSENNMITKEITDNILNISKVELKSISFYFRRTDFHGCGDYVYLDLKNTKKFHNQLTSEDFEISPNSIKSNMFNFDINQVMIN